VVSLDYSLGIQVVNFLVLIFILNVLLYKPILDIIDKRRKRFEESEAEIKHLQAAVDQKMAAYEEELRLAKLAAVERKNEMIREGSDEARQVINAVREEIPRLMEQFQSRMAGEVAEARKVLTGRAQKLSIEIAEKVLGRSLG
jgi:F-type H+-transporting ATPase subunit b